MDIKEAIKDLYENTELPMMQIATKVGVGSKVVWNYVKKNYSHEYRVSRKAGCYSQSKMGDKNPMLGKHPGNFKGECSDGKGYLTVVRPSWYTVRKGYCRVFKHHVVMCEHLGITTIPKGYCIHHIDGNKTNNSIDNLMLMTMSAHTKLHQQLRYGTVQRLDTEHSTPEE